MRRWLIWSFERGSLQYDVMCGLIIASIFLIPPAVFDDRPGYMRLDQDTEVQRSADDDGNTVYTVLVPEDSGAGEAAETAARRRLESFLGSEAPLDVVRSEPVHNTRGGVEAYSYWVR